MKEGSEVGLCGQDLDLGRPTPAFTHVYGRELSHMAWPARKATGGCIGCMTEGGKRGFAGHLFLPATGETEEFSPTQGLAVRS